VTRFAAGTKTESSSKAEKPVLARDHSLGREYLQDGEAVSVEGFSWRDPFLADGDKRNTSMGSATAPPMAPAAPGAYPPAGRHSSSGSLGIAPPHHGGPPPPPDYYGRVGSNQLREYSTGRIESWGSFPYPPPPPPPAVHGPTHQRSGSWTYNQTPPPAMPGHQRSGSWSGRDHSLAFNPLIGASIAHPADRGTFEGRGGPPQQYWGPGPGQYRSPPSQLSPANSTPSPKPTYNVNMDIARTWSGGAEGNPRPGWMEQQNQQMAYGQPTAAPGADISPMRNNAGFMPKPQMVKRDTSHQAESSETKHQVKRAALNRDNSMASNRLKEQYMPEYYNGKFNTDHEVKKLSVNLEQSQLSPKRAEPTTAKPESLKDSNRLTTLDINDLMSKPEPLSTRTTTIEALGIDLENEPMFDAPIEGGSIPRPNAMTTDNRLTTTEIYELVNADPEDLVKVDEGPPPLNQETVADNWLAQS